MNPHHIAIIGCGNMGTSLMGGLLQKGHLPENITVSDPSANSLESLHLRFGIQTTQNNCLAVDKADVVILAVKPQIMKKVADEIATILQKNNPLVISIAAGIPVHKLEQWLGSDLAIVRCMPNTPALVGYGATGLFANKKTDTKRQKLTESMLSAVGTTVWVTDEKHMDIVTALSGSGPAYFFLVMEAMQKAAEQMGLPQDTAKQLTLQTCLGSAQIALQSDKSLNELRKNVTSPGGTTEQAILVLEKAAIHATFQAALQAAKNQSEKLSQLAE